MAFAPIGGSDESIFLPALALLLSLTSTTQAQEDRDLGRMWTFENPPLEYLERRYGFEPAPEWLDALRLGSLRLGGADALSGPGSASFVSPEGLILTSSRCVGVAVAATLDADGPARGRDPLGIIKTGFVAAAPKQEIRLRARHGAWLTAAQLIRSSDVTDRVNDGVAATDDHIELKRKRDANRESILEAARQADPELVPRIVSLYLGGVYRLYQYRVYDDVRLVVLPHVRVARFGGRPDTFTYPRHGLDFAFLRAYEDGKPANTTKHYFPWKSGGAKQGDLVFVSGNPGTTRRLFTKAQLELERDTRIPLEIERLMSSLRRSKDPGGNAFSGEFDPENPSDYWAGVRMRILEEECDLKAARGNLQGLDDAKLMEHKTAAEKAFRTRVMADESLAARYGDLWDRIASVVRRRRSHTLRARFHTAADLVLDAAVDVVRLGDPGETEEHRKRAEEKLEAWAGATIAPNYYATAAARDHLVQARSWLPEDDPLFTRVLGGKSPDEFLNAISPPESSRPPSWVGFPAPRDDLVKSGWSAIRGSEDPAIVAARELVLLMRKHEALGKELDAHEEALGAEIARALFACYGTGVSPDGTETLRFTDGVVKGYPCNGTIAPYHTTFYGLFARNAEFDDEHPFNLPMAWLERKDTIDMTKPVNFVSTNDITHGNSGSVVVNKDLEVVGLVVDGNMESLHNDFVFRDDVPRAVSVHVDGIMEALVKVYDARRIAKELTAR